MSTAAASDQKQPYQGGWQFGRQQEQQEEVAILGRLILAAFHGASAALHRPSN
jgi:hypothetical protein